MKSYSHIGAALTLILWDLAMPMVAIAHSLETVEAALKAKEPHAQLINQEAPLLETIPASETHRDPVTFNGKTLIVNFAAANCQETCASHMELIAELQQMVNAAHMIEQVQFITITTGNGTTDQTMAQLAAFADRFELNPDNWAPLNASADLPDAGIQQADQFGVTVAGQDDLPESEVATFVIDREGQLRARFEGLAFQPINLVSYTNALVYDVHVEHERQPPAIARPSKPKPDITNALISGGVLVSGLAIGLWWYKRRRKEHE